MIDGDSAMTERWGIYMRYNPGKSAGHREKRKPSRSSRRRCLTIFEVYVMDSGRVRPVGL